MARMDKKEKKEIKANKYSFILDSLSKGDIGIKGKSGKNVDNIQVGDLKVMIKKSINEQFKYMLKYQNEQNKS